MNCDEAKMKCQMLIDDELDEEEIAPLMDHIESCYKCREEYIGLLKLRKRLNGIKSAASNELWFDRLERRKGRRFFSRTGLFLLIASYIFLIGYAVFTLVKDPEESLLIKIAVAAVIVSVCVLFSVSLSDRIRESKNDKYKGVLK